MGSLSEDAAKRALNIDSWHNLSKEQVLGFIEVIPTLDKDVALGIIEQLPHFKKLALGALNSLEKQYKFALDSDQVSQKRVHQAFRDYRAALKEELRNGDLGPSDRLRVLEMIQEAAERDYAKDSEHKAFVLKLVGVFASLLFVLIAGAVAVATGGRINLRST